ncbi:cytochrome c oxidase subunit II [Sporosarcina sp. P16b]|uniref:cytochrome c oxidase subunit II n=1 Tax=Sporosarcina sp. P16b TaxID=2048261 RepID=UPI000C16345A|nr:cytochrome c oxidase subunit II [Sporosarcina sp. P16b]PIC70274.1 cytochrome c oxidase subunit II [Sporosarcina sp. P16b]
MKKIRLLFPLLLLSGCSNITVLNPKSTTGKDQAFLIWLGFGIMFLVLAVVFFLLVKIIITYRYKKEREHDPTNYLNDKQKRHLQLAWTIIPIILLVILSIPALWISYHQSPVAEAESRHEGVHIHVSAKQFQWTFTYDTDKTEENLLILPEGESIILHLSTEDVIHSFWVPELAGKVDLIPNKPIVNEIKEPEIGVYKGKCAEYCGIQHTNMTFTVKVVSKEEYENYINN